MGACASRPEVHDAGLPGQQALPSKQPLSATPPASTSAPEHTALSIISGKQPLTPGTPRQDTIPAKLAYARAQTPVGPPQACPPPSPLSQARLYRMAYPSNCASHPCSLAEAEYLRGCHQAHRALVKRARQAAAPA